MNLILLLFVIDFCGKIGEGGFLKQKFGRK
jgi:hypothetical protein